MNKVRNKNPKQYDEFMSGLIAARRKDPKTVVDFVKGSTFNQYLSPDEIKTALGGDFEDYVQTVDVLRQRGFADDVNRELYCDIEKNKETGMLAFGKRFMSAPIVTSIAATRIDPLGQKYVDSKMFAYDPKTKSIQKIVKKG
jgi:hypothetical protein